MMSGNDNAVSSLMSRRSVLKTTGLGLGSIVGGSGGVSAANDEGRRDELLEKSHKILMNTGSVEKQHKFLRNKGFSTKMDQQSYAVPRSDGVSTQSFDRDDLDITMSLFKDCRGDGNYTAELTWDYKYNWDDIGSDPWDVAGIGWEEGYWDYESYDLAESTYTGGDITVQYRDGTSGSGPGFNVADVDSTDGDRGYCGVNLVPLGDYSIEERILQGAYSHTWESVTIDSVSVAYPYGVSVSVTDESYEWKTDTEIDGTTLLRLNQADAECSCYC